MERFRFLLPAVAAASAFFCLGVLELGACVYLRHFAPESRFVAYASLAQLQERYASGEGERESKNQLLAPHRYLGYYPTPGYDRGKNRHNSLGYRGAEIVQPKPNGEYRIVCLGGSTTYDSDIEDWRLAYPAQLEAVLRGRGFDRVTVVNAGAMGWTSWESLVNLEFRVLELQPDLVIDFDALNDVHARMVWPSSAYRGDDSGYRAANSGGAFMPGLLEYSTLARIVMIRAGWIASHADITRTIDRLAPTYFGDAWRDQRRTGTYPDGVFRQASGAAMLAANPPVHFERNVGSLIGVARAHGVRVMLASFAYSPEFPEEPRVTSPEYRDAITEHNRVLARVASATSTPFFDFAAEFPTDRRFFTDGRHNNEEGARRKAELFAEFLAESGLLPAPASLAPNS